MTGLVMMFGSRWLSRLFKQRPTRHIGWWRGIHTIFYETFVGWRQSENGSYELAICAMRLGERGWCRSQ